MAGGGGGCGPAAPPSAVLGDIAAVGLPQQPVASPRGGSGGTGMLVDESKGKDKGTLGTASSASRGDKGEGADKDKSTGKGGDDAVWALRGRVAALLRRLKLPAALDKIAHDPRELQLQIGALEGLAAAG